MASHRHALWWLAAISFMESSFFPIPPDIMLIPMILARPNRELVRVTSEQPEARPVWIVIHADLKHAPAVRVVADMLVTALGAM